MNKAKKLCAVLTTMAMVGGVVMVGAADYVADGSYLNIGGTGTNSEGATSTTARVDARAGASILVTSKASGDDNPYGTGNHPSNLGDGTDVAKIVVHNARTDIGLDTYASKTGTAIGAYAKSNGVQSAALGYKAEVTRSASNSVALGSNSVADEANTISVGSSSLERRITHVADGISTTDAATVGQLQRTASSIQQNVTYLGNEIDQVGAISAALAGLHPLQSSKGFEISAAGGAYDGKQAMALGGFYHANPDVMVSFSGATSFGSEHKTAGNVGLTFRVGPKETSRLADNQDTTGITELAQRLDLLNQKVEQLEQENKALKQQMAQGK
ncbi:YadA-like family protein [Megasphaera sp. WILCCON 0056]|uniref:YadA-like family protein n=1 Tax=Megasphaera sp. WILCCON 0056 TaxID=3345340 RepID=UPI003A7FCF56